MEFYYIPLKLQKRCLSPHRAFIGLMYDEEYEILECSEDNRLFGISQQQIYETLETGYSDDGHLSKITVEDKRHIEQLVYIFFPDRHTAEKMVKEWSLKISNSLSAHIIRIKEPLSRLFLDY